MGSALTRWFLLIHTLLHNPGHPVPRICRSADYELILPTVIGGGSGKNFGVGGRMWKVDVGLEEITGSVDGISGIMAKGVLRDKL
jgi:hypothetical protein